MNIIFACLLLISPSEPLALPAECVTSPLEISSFGDAEDPVLQAEKTRFKAMVDKDFAMLDQVISEDLVYIHSNGNVDSKESFIAPLKDGSRSYDDITIDDPKVRMYGDVGIINASCTYHRTTPEGRPNNLILLYTSVYAKIDDRWQHVSWQSFKVVE